MFAAVAAGPELGGYASIVDAAERMAHLSSETYVPTPRDQAVYELIYGQYVHLHDLFGRSGSEAMKALRRIREQVRIERFGPEPSP
jgi:L-ribulokinase